MFDQKEIGYRAYTQFGLADQMMRWALYPQVADRVDRVWSPNRVDLGCGSLTVVRRRGLCKVAGNVMATRVCLPILS